jgi:hypothetical protein
MSKIRTLRKVISTYGLYEVVKVLRNKLISNTKQDFNFENLEFIGAQDFLTNILRIDKEKIDKIKSNLDFENTLESKPERESFFGEIYDLGRELSLILIAIIKVSKPQKILETGVAAGKSTTLILKQLDANNFGELVSMDITDKVGELIPSNLKHRWTLKVLPKLREKITFKNLLLQLQPFQIFLHDSDHSYAWQQFELEQVLGLHDIPRFVIIDDANPIVLGNLREKFPEIRIFCIQEISKIGAVCLV